MNKRKILITIGVSIIVVIVCVLIGNKCYQHYLYEKGLNEILDSADNSVPLTKEQLDVISGNIEKVLYDFDTSYFVSDNTELGKVDSNSDNVPDVSTNVDEFIRENKDLLEYYTKFITVKPNYEKSAVYVYDKRDIAKVTASFDFTYPDLERIIKYNLFKECAQDKKSKVELGLLTDTIKDYVKEYGSTVTAMSTLQLDVLVSDSDANDFTFLNDWFTQLDYHTYLTDYDLIEGSFDTCELNTDYEIIDKFNSGDFEWVAQSLYENAEKYNYSNYDNVEYLYFNQLDKSVKSQLASEYLSIGNFDVFPVKAEVSLDGEDDEVVVTKGEFLLASIPYVNYDQEGYGFRHETKTSLISASYADVYSCLYEVFAGVSDAEVEIAE